MPTETEHKYLVKKDLWGKVHPEKSLEIKQGYLLTDPEKTIRVRIKNGKGFLTIKGKTNRSSRPEFEYEIPLKDAEELIGKFCSAVVEKTRHLVHYEEKLWEVDEFRGANNGLMVAEIELKDEDEKYALPEWADKNVTKDPKYANSNLSVNPYSNWK